MSDQYSNIKVQLLLDTSQFMQQYNMVKDMLDKIKKGGGVQRTADVFTESYATTIRNLTRQAEAAYRQFNETGDIKFLNEYKSLIPTIQQLSKEQEIFNKSILNTDNSVKILGTSLKKHIGWILTGVGMGSAIGGIIAGVQDMARLETEFNQLKTVLPELEENQQSYNRAMRDAFALAERYGTAVEQVTESLRLMGRGYHELSQSEKLAEVALKLSVADNFDPQTATRAIEAVIGAYGKQAEAVEFANKVMDSMTKVSHTSQISANDLAEALLRSAAAAHAVGVSYDELNAMIAVIARNTGLTGQTIGDGQF